MSISAFDTVQSPNSPFAHSKFALLELGSPPVWSILYGNFATFLETDNSAHVVAKELRRQVLYNTDHICGEPTASSGNFEDGTGEFYPSIHSSES